jgi:hypothetical protein
MPLFHSLGRNHNICPGPTHVCRFRNCASFYGEKFSAPRPTPKLMNHPLLSVRDCLFNIFATTLHIGGLTYNRTLRTRHTVATGTLLSWHRVVISMNTPVHRMAAQLCLN